MDKSVQRHPRYNVVSMRISTEERKRLNAIAVKSNMNVSDIMRIAFENYKTLVEVVTNVPSNT